MSLTARKGGIEIFKYCATSACVIVLYKVKIFKSSFPRRGSGWGGLYPSYLFHVNVSTIRWKMSDTPRLSRKREGWRLNGPLSPTDLAPPAQTRRILLGTLDLGSTNNEGKYILNCWSLHKINFFSPCWNQNFTFLLTKFVDLILIIVL